VILQVIELDQRPDGDAVQDALAGLTGGRSVPRVFIGGEFLGGNDDTQAMPAAGEPVIACPSPLNVLKDTYDHSCS
jgi:glutaredoxin